MDTTGRAFVEHWDWAIEKGLMKPNSARALSSAVKQVLSVDDDWETKDVLQIDVDGLLQRFRNLRGKDFKPRTLAEYERRFKRALDLFAEYTQDPANWMPPTTRARESAKSKPTRRQANGDLRADQPARFATSPPQRLIDYPFPLRKDCVVTLTLPSDLRVSEVERVAAFMRTLSLDFDTSAETS